MQKIATVKNYRFVLSANHQSDRNAYKGAIGAVMVLQSRITIHGCERSNAVDAKPLCLRLWRRALKRPIEAVADTSERQRSTDLQPNTGMSRLAAV